MNAKELMDYQYLKMQKLPLTSSLFFNEKSSLDLFGGSSFYALFLPLKKELQGIEVFDRHVLVGERTNYLFNQLQELKGEDNAIDILPGYFVYDNSYYLIVEVDLDTKFHEISRMLEALVHVENLTVKCHFDEKKTGEVFSHLEGMRRVLQTTVTDHSMIQSIGRDETLQDVKKFIKDQLMVSAHFFQLSIYLQLQASSEEELVQLYEQVKLIATIHLFKLKRHHFIQYELIEKFYLQKVKEKLPSNYLLVQSEALKSDFPCAHLGLYDEEGKYLGHDVNRHPIFLDIWKRDALRVNSNFLVLGQSGQGKTTFAKRILEVSKEERLFVFDPESEYHFEKREEVHRVVLKEGYIIEELFSLSFDEEFSLGFFVQHFAYVTKAPYEEQQLFKKFLRKVGSFCSAKKVATLLQEMNMPLRVRSYVEEIFNAPRISLKSDKRIQHFTIDAKLQVLSDTSRILYFELLSYIWLKLMQSTEKKIFLMDEAYLLFQSGDVMLVTLLQNMFKRMRKYDGSIGLVTQNIGDYMMPENRHALMSIFDNSNYHFVFKSEGADRQHLIELLSLSEENIAKLDSLKRGECLLICRRSQIGKMVTFLNE